MIRATLLLITASSLLLAQGRGGAPARPPATGKSAAPWDPTGYWVSEIVDEWRFRVSPVNGDVLYMPINAEARRIANAWDPAKDEAGGNQCKAYGAVGLMQRPGRLHITWVDDNTIRIDADAGTQTRTLYFGRPLEPAQTTDPPSLQGNSIAGWEGPGFGDGGRGRGGPAVPPKTGALKVVTTNLLPGYLRKNGVPYDGKTVYTEYINRLEGQQGEVYLSLTAMVDDPTYLTGPFVRTYEFKRLPDSSGWEPTPCWTR